MLKKLLLSTLVGITLLTNSVVAGERMAKGNEIYNPNNYTEEYDNETNRVLLIPDYFKRVYKDTNDVLEQYIPMYFNGELFPVCIERIYRYYYYDDNDNKIYFDYGQSIDIYNINGNDYISIR